MPKEKNNSARLILDVLIMLPLFIFFYTTISNALGLTSFNATPLVYGIALLISIIAYALSLAFRRVLYIKDDIPVDTSMFIGDLFILPFILLFPPNNTQAITGIFVPLEVSIIVSASVFALVGMTFKRAEFPRLDNPTALFANVVMILLLSILSIMFFAFDQYSDIGFAFSYLSVFSLLTLAIYTVQLLAYRDKFGIKRFLSLV